MKSLMFGVAALAACASLGAVSSANVVGYVEDASVEQNNFVGIPFNTVGYNTADIQQIKLSDDGAESIGWGDELFAVWEGTPTVVANSGFTYCDKSYYEGATDYYWGDNDGIPASYSIAPGQGVVISMAEGITITYSGDVNGEDVTFTSVDQNNFCANTFSASIDIQAIKLSDDGAESIGWGDELFAVWEGTPTVVANSGFTYCDKSYYEGATDYYWGDNDGIPASYSIAPGQGVVISASGGLNVTISAPYSL